MKAACGGGNSATFAKLGCAARLMGAKKAEKILRITLTKSPIGYSYRQKRTVKALGLRKMNEAVEKRDSAAIRGMVAKVSHLVSVEEIDK